MMKLNKIMSFFSGSSNESSVAEYSCEDSRVVWTGPSVRVRSGQDLLDSEEMKRDIEAAIRLNQALLEKSK